MTLVRFQYFLVVKGIKMFHEALSNPIQGERYSHTGT